MAAGDPVESPSEFTKIPYEYQAQLRDLDRKRQLAQVLMQTLKNAPQGQMVGNHFVPPSITQYIANGLQGAMMARMINDTSQGEQGILNNMAGAQQADLARMQQLNNPTTIASPTPNDDNGNPMPAAVTPGNPVAAAQYGMQSRFPQIQAIAKALQSDNQSRFATMAPHASNESIAQANGNPNALIPNTTRSVPTPPGATPGAYQIDRNGKMTKVDSQSPIILGASGLDKALEAQQAFLMADKQRGAVESAVNALPAIQEAMQLLESGLVNTGTFSDIATKFQALAGPFIGKVPPTASGTQLYQSFIVPMVGNIVKQFGNGTAISNADREYAARAVADASMQPEMAKVALAHMARGAFNEIQRYNSLVNTLGDVADSDPQTAGRSKLYRSMSITMPEFQTPASYPVLGNSTGPLSPYFIKKKPDAKEPQDLGVLR